MSRDNVLQSQARYALKALRELYKQEKKPSNQQIIDTLAPFRAVAAKVGISYIELSVVMGQLTGVLRER